MADYPSFPVFVADLLADTRHLNPEEFGTYFQILCVMWISPKGQIPNDDKWLRRHFPGYDLDTVKAMLAEFCKTNGNSVTQKRLQEELAYVKSKSAQGSAAAKTRWKKQNTPCEPDAAGICESDASRNAPTPTLHLEESPLSPLIPKGPSRPVAGPEKVTEKPWLAMLGRYQEILDRLWPDRIDPWPHPTDATTAAEWHKLGLDPNSLEGLLRPALAARAESGQPAPKSMRYFSNQIAERAKIGGGQVIYLTEAQQRAQAEADAEWRRLQREG